MKTKTIKQTITLPATPAKVYSTLLDGKALSKMHGAKATMSKRPNGKFTVFDGYCHGYNLDLVEGQKIEQAWVFMEEGWPEDHSSICTFLLQPSTKGTKLAFIHKNVPNLKYQAIKEGWKAYYWEPLIEYLLK